MHSSVWKWIELAGGAGFIPERRIEAEGKKNED
jgi:hypothetical protein